MIRDKQSVFAELDKVFAAGLGRPGAGNVHVAEEDENAVRPGAHFQLQVTLEQWPPSGGGVGENHRGGCQ